MPVDLPAAQHGAHGGMTMRRKRVLVAEDVPDVADRICTVLRDAADLDIVGPAADGVEALRLYETHLPDCAVLDIGMPLKDGIAVLKGIRSGGRPCLVIMLTNYNEASIREACFAAGADHFLQKWDDFDRAATLVAGYVRPDDV